METILVSTSRNPAATETSCRFNVSLYASADKQFLLPYQHPDTSAASGAKTLYYRPPSA
jgi:hypothetical protein